VPLMVLLAFLPKIFSLIPFLSGVNPLWVLIGCLLVAMPFIAFQAFRERNTFTHLALISTLAGLALIFSADFLFNEVLQDHQRKRIEVLLGMKEDPSGVGYNVNQSKIAIGSGGFLGSRAPTSYSAQSEKNGDS